MLLRWAWTLGAAALLTGLVPFVAGPYLPQYFLWLRVHALVSVGFGLVLVPALVRHVLGTGGSLVATTAAVVLGAVAAWPAPWALVLDEEEHDGGPIAAFASRIGRATGEGTDRWLPLLGAVTLASLITAVVVLVLVGLVSRTREREASRRTGFGLTVLAAWALVSGLAPWVAPVHLRVPAQTLHSFAGVMGAVVLVLHLGARWAARSRLRPTAVVLLGAALLLGSWVGIQMRYRLTRQWLVARTWTMPTTDDARAKHWVGEGTASPLEDHHVGESASCGTAGCHENLYAEWAASPHANAGRHRAYGAAVEALLARGESARVVACATCHDPVRVAVGTLGRDYAAGVPGEGEGVSCQWCHRIGAVLEDPPANGLVAVDAVRPYPGETPEERLANLRLDTRHHRDSFVFNEQIYESDICVACHRLQVGDHLLQAAELPSAAADGGEISCRLCHLQPSGGSTYGHRMAGLNLDQERLLPAAADTAPHAEAVRRFTGAKPLAPLPSDTWRHNLEWEPARPGGEGGAPLVLDVQARRAAQTVEVTVRLRNAGAGHAYPIGPFDLHQHWIELWVGDAGGSTLLHRGAATGEGPAEAFVRLGARELDAEGRPIREHRVHDIEAVLDRLQLAAGETKEWTTTVEIPPTSHGTLDVRARLLFRRLDPLYSAWALGDPRPLPVWELAGNVADVP